MLRVLRLRGLFLRSEQIQLVKQSFSWVARQADEFGRLFYDRLFDLDPGLRPLFKVSIEIQSKKLMEMLTVVVNNLDHLDTILPAIRSLGVQHAGYGVTEKHYESVASALLWALERELGPRFTAPVREAWIAAYGLIAETMKAASREPSASC